MITMTFSSLVACKRKQTVGHYSFIAMQLWAGKCTRTISIVVLLIHWCLVPNWFGSWYHTKSSHFIIQSPNQQLITTLVPRVPECRGLAKKKRPTCNLVNVSWCVQRGLDFNAGLKNLRYIWPHYVQCKQKVPWIVQLRFAGPHLPSCVYRLTKRKACGAASLFSLLARSCALHDAMVRAGIRGFTLKVVAFFSFKVRPLFWPVFYTSFY
jgi:hypothetical protein